MYALYEQGTSIAELAEQFEITPRYVHMLIKDAGLETRTARVRAVTSADLHEMYALYEQGASLGELAGQFGLSKSRVGRLFKQAGLEIRPAGGPVVDPKVLQEMYAMYQQGATLEQVGERFGITASSVSNLFKRASLKARSALQSSALRPKPKAPEWPVQEMYLVYQDGATLGEVGEQFELSASTVSKLFKAAGLKVPVRTGLDMHPVGEMYAMYEQGATTQEVGERFGMSKSAVSYLFKRAGLETRPGSQTAALRPKAPKWPVQDMYRVYQNGATLGEVGEQFGLSASAVSKQFKAAGLKTRALASGLDIHPVGEMYAMYEQGATTQEVGERYGMSKDAVAHLFRRAGLKARSSAQSAALKAQAEAAKWPVQEMYSVYRDGASLQEVGDRFGIPTSTVTQLFGRHGLKPRRREKSPQFNAKTRASKTRRSERPLQEMHAIYQQGASLIEVGYEFELSGTMVRQLFKAAGLEVRSKGRSSSTAE